MIRNCNLAIVDTRFDVAFLHCRILVAFHATGTTIPLEISIFGVQWTFAQIQSIEFIDSKQMVTLSVFMTQRIVEKSEQKRERERESEVELFFELRFETICSSISFARDLFARKFLSFVVVFIFIFSAQNVDTDAYQLDCEFFYFSINRTRIDSISNPFDRTVNRFLVRYYRQRETRVHSRTGIDRVIRYQARGPTKRYRLRFSNSETRLFNLE